jgi:tRNA (guanine-N7-)-methyltransferase
VRKLLDISTFNFQLSTLQNVNFVFNKIYILHPDPWPKTRHEKRRLLSAGFLNELANHLTPDGQIIIGTDHADYFEWTLNEIKDSKLRIANDDFTVPPESGLDTRYKKKDMFGANKTQYLVLVTK